MAKRPGPTISVTHEGGGVLKVESRRKDSEKLVMQRVVLSHVNAGKLKGHKPRPGIAVIVPLFFSKHAGGAGKMLRGTLITDTIREIGQAKAGRLKSAYDQNIIAHLGNQERIYRSLERRSREGKGNVSHERLNLYGVPSGVIKAIEGGDARLEIKFDSDHLVDLNEGTVVFGDNVGDRKKIHLLEEELARLLLAFDQIALARLNKKTYRSPKI